MMTVGCVEPVSWALESAEAAAGMLESAEAAAGALESVGGGRLRADPADVLVDRVRSLSRSWCRGGGKSEAIRVVVGTEFERYCRMTTTSDRERLRGGRMG